MPSSCFVTLIFGHRTLIRAESANAYNIQAQLKLYKNCSAQKGLLGNLDKNIRLKINFHGMRFLTMKTVSLDMGALSLKAKHTITATKKLYTNFGWKSIKVNHDHNLFQNWRIGAFENHYHLIRSTFTSQWSPSFPSLFLSYKAVNSRIPVYINQLHNITKLQISLTNMLE